MGGPGAVSAGATSQHKLFGEADQPNSGEAMAIVSICSVAWFVFGIPCGQALRARTGTVGTSSTRSIETNLRNSDIYESDTTGPEDPLAVI